MFFLHHLLQFRYGFCGPVRCAVHNSKLMFNATTRMRRWIYEYDTRAKVYQFECKTIINVVSRLFRSHCLCLYPHNTSRINLLRRPCFGLYLPIHKTHRLRRLRWIQNCPKKQQWNYVDLSLSSSVWHKLQFSGADKSTSFVLFYAGFFLNFFRKSLFGRMSVWMRKSETDGMMSLIIYDLICTCRCSFIPFLCHHCYRDCDQSQHELHNTRQDMNYIDEIARFALKCHSFLSNTEKM